MDSVATTIKANAKAVVAFFTTLGTWGATALADGSVSGVEWFGICGVIVATFTVWVVTNTPNRNGGSGVSDRSTHPLDDLYD